jgi:hypothetical protein
MAFKDTRGYRIADLTCPVHGAHGTNPGDGYWEIDDTKIRSYRHLAEEVLKHHLDKSPGDDGLLIGILGAQLEIIDLLNETIVHLEERRNL